MASNFQQNNLLGSDEDEHIEEATSLALTSETEEISVPLTSKIGDDMEPIEEAGTSKEESKLQQQVQKKFCVFLMSNLPDQDLLSQADNFLFFTTQKFQYMFQE